MSYLTELFRYVPRKRRCGGTNAHPVGYIIAQKHGEVYIFLKTGKIPEKKQ